MMGLVAPMNDGVGGDLFAIVYEAKTGKLYGLNASGWAPAGLTADYLLGKGIKAMPQNGIHIGDGARRGGRMGQAAEAVRAQEVSPTSSHRPSPTPTPDFPSAKWSASTGATARRH